jgi:hypothetical protein
VGFGPGLHVLPLGLDWVLPPEPAAPLEATSDLKAKLEAEGIYGRGLITLFAAARSQVEDGRQRALRSNQVTVQIAENTERLKVARKVPAEVTGGGMKPDPKPSLDRQQGKGGGGPPDLGPPEEILEGRRLPSAVKPLLQDAGLVEKEVEVFERQSGGEGPAAEEQTPLPESPLRTFIRRSEEAMPHLALSPADRRMLKMYWESVQRRGS